MRDEDFEKFRRNQQIAHKAKNYSDLIKFVTEIKSVCDMERGSQYSDIASVARDLSKPFITAIYPDPDEKILEDQRIIRKLIIEHFNNFHRGYNLKFLPVYLKWFWQKDEQAARKYLQSINFQFSEPSEPPPAALPAPEYLRRHDTGFVSLKSDDDVIPVIERLRKIDSELDALFYSGMDDRPNALELIVEKEHRILAVKERLHVTADADRFTVFLTELFSVPHWADRRIQDRRYAYNAIIDTVAPKLQRRQWSMTYKLLLTSAANRMACGKNDEAYSLLKELPPTLAFDPDEAPNRVIVDRYDTLITTYADTSVSEVCDYLGDNTGKNMDSASIWRCQACLALRSGNIEAARVACEEARVLYEKAHKKIQTTEDRMVPHYLNIIAMMCDLRENTRIEELPRRACELIPLIEAEDPHATPLLAALHFIIAKALETEPHSNGHELEAQKVEIISANRNIVRLLKHANLNFCFFDVSAVHTEAAGAIAPPEN